MPQGIGQGALVIEGSGEVCCGIQRLGSTEDRLDVVLGQRGAQAGLGQANVDETRGFVMLRWHILYLGPRHIKARSGGLILALLYARHGRIGGSVYGQSPIMLLLSNPHTLPICVEGFGVPVLCREHVSQVVRQGSYECSMVDLARQT